MSAERVKKNTKSKEVETSKVDMEKINAPRNTTDQIKKSDWEGLMELFGKRTT